MAVLLGDLDNLKELNDTLGHARGDQALAAVAAALCAERRGERAGRCTGWAATSSASCSRPEPPRRRMRQASGRSPGLRAGAEPTVSASFGVASIGLGAGRPADLLRAADHALYVAKRAGRNRVCVADASHDAVWDGVVDRSAHPRRHLRDGDSLEAAALLRRALRDLDGELSVAGPFQRLEAVVAHVCGAVDAARASISFEAAGSGMLATYWTVNLRAGRTWSKGAGPGADAYATDDYPETARILGAGGSFVVSVDDPDADPAETDLLQAFRMSAVLAAAAPADGGSWLVEIYADRSAARARAGRADGASPRR